MNKLFLLLGTLPILLQPSCEDKKCKNMKFLSEIKEDYILDSCLTREFYKEYSMDIPKEGVVLTPEIAEREDSMVSLPLHVIENKIISFLF